MMIPRTQYKEMTGVIKATKPAVFKTYIKHRHRSGRGAHMGLLAMITALGLLDTNLAKAAPGDTLQVAAQKSAVYLQNDIYNFSQGNNCQACHRQGAAVFGLANLHERGYVIDRSERGHRPGVPSRPQREPSAYYRRLLGTLWKPGHELH